MVGWSLAQTLKKTEGITRPTSSRIPDPKQQPQQQVSEHRFLSPAAPGYRPGRPAKQQQPGDPRSNTSSSRVSRPQAAGIRRKQPGLYAQQRGSRSSIPQHSGVPRRLGPPPGYGPPPEYAPRRPRDPRLLLWVTIGISRVDGSAGDASGPASLGGLLGFS